jgi:tellurite resistance protein TerC
MRPRDRVKCLVANHAWSDNLAVIRDARFTRYPLITADPDRPIGFIHLKDLLIRGDPAAPDLERLVRPLLATRESTSLEALLADMQRQRVHAALVTDEAGAWTGFITLEDVVEELVGTIRDEFEDEEPIRLADVLSADCVHLDVEGDSPVAAVRAALLRTPAAALPLPADQIVGVVEQRERLVGTYLGQGIGLPHARLAGLPRPFLMILRSAAGVRCAETAERAHLLFVLLTPNGQPRVHQRLLSMIARVLHESDYVRERLLTAETPAEVIEILRTGEQAALG